MNSEPDNAGTTTVSHAPAAAGNAPAASNPRATGPKNVGCLNFLNTTSDQLWNSSPPPSDSEHFRKLREVANTRDIRNGSCSDGSEVSDETLWSMVLSSRRRPRTTSSTKPASASKPKVLTHKELKSIVQNAPGDLVEGLIPEKSVNIFVGDSGLGKTPLLVQLALCVTAGLPFLNQPTRKGHVLYVDFENGQAGFDNLLDTLDGYLGLPETPDTFRVMHQPSSVGEVIAAVKQFRPSLVIVDALRGFDPKAETKNEVAGERLAELHKLAEETGSAFALLHHIRKQDLSDPPDPLALSSIMDWLLQASGARSLINQTDVRFGIDTYKVGEAELMIKGHYKLRGPFGPIQIARVYDAEGEPIGYRRLIGVDLLPQEQRVAYSQVPDEFTFTQAAKAIGKGPKTVAEWLRAWQSAGVLDKTGKAKSKDVRYRKVAPGKQHSG